MEYAKNDVIIEDRPNEEIVWALMQMVDQFFHHTVDVEKKEAFVHHSYMSAEENAMRVLIKHGFAEEVGKNKFKLNWEFLK